MYDNTLLVVLSDNGADPTYCGSNFPYRGKKGSLFEAGVLVPGFLAGGLIPEDLRVRSSPSSL
jgi:arylsulfatase A-like enzyme